MQVSVKWLKDYIEFKETPEELAELLTMAGVPVENICDMGAGLDKVVTGKIIMIEKHPDADRLSICTVDIGADAPLIIVTGATNVREDQIVPVAMIGAKLPNGVKISKGKLRGVASYGMLCSASELQLDLNTLTQEQKAGIFILDAKTKPGLPVKDVLGLNDVVLEFELTANRADCFSVMGLVREISALTGNPVKKPMISLHENTEEKASDFISVKIEATDLCKRFAARVLRDVKVGPSPDWMKKRIEAAGIRSINNVVDVTNFVMLELGQPMHAYDRQMLANHMLVVRRANPGEPLTTLDSVKRDLTPEMLVISDSMQAVGVAGVMGGLATEITEATKTVILEAAAFQGVSVRRTSRALGLRSEASGRFERGVDVANIVKALDRAAQLLEEMGVCRVCEGIVDVYPGFEIPQQVKFNVDEINRHLGAQIEKSVMIDILTNLEFEVQDGLEQMVVTIPTWRNDVRYMADIAEEIARIYGFNRIASTFPAGPMMRGGQSAKQDFIDRAREILCAAGMSEAISFGFTHPETFDKMNVPEDSALRTAVPILNPITDEFPLLRTTVTSSILEAMARNLARKNDDVQLFEIGTVFYPQEIPLKELPEEYVMISGALTGRRNPAAWNQGREMVDFFDAKGIVENFLHRLGIMQYTVQSGQHHVLHPGKTAVFRKGKEVIAYVGEVHPEVQRKMNITKKTYLFEMNVETLMKYAAAGCRYTSLPKYPAVVRDLAIVLDQSITAEDVYREIVQTAGKLLKESCLFDVYRGEQVAPGKKSLAFSLQFQSSEKTLTDEEVDGVYHKVLQALEKKFSAALRH